MGERWHVVCHDCTTEGIEHSEAEAVEGAYDHRQRTGHDVEVGRVA